MAFPLPSSRTPDAAPQPDVPGGPDLLRGLLSHLYDGGDCRAGQNAQHIQEERLQQPDGRPQAGQEHPAAQTGNRK